MLQKAQLLQTILRVLASRKFFIATFVYFAAVLIFFAIFVSQEIFPDEPHHIGLIQLLSSQPYWPLPIIVDQTNYYFLGGVQNSPFILYHYILSLPYNLIFNGLPLEYVGLRLGSLAMGLLTMYVVVKICREIAMTALETNLVVFSLASTTMFIAIFSAVSYDALYVLASMVSMLLLIKFVKFRDISTLILLGTVISLGMLTKINFAPIAFASTGIVFFVLIQAKKKNSPLFEKTFSAKNRRHLLLLGFLVISLMLASSKYIPNLISYSSVSPSCTTSLSLEQCRENDVFARNERIRNSTNPEPTADGFVYVTTWIDLMVERTYGFHGHKQLYNPTAIGLLLMTLLGIGLIAFIRLVMPGRDYIYIMLAVITAFSVFVLIIQNYSIYQWTGRIDFAVQGRYLFGVLPLLMILLIHYLLRWPSSQTAKAMTAIITILLFAISGPVMFVVNAGPEWFTNPFWGL